MRILIAIIAYNEAKNLPLVFEDLRQHNFGYDILLVDNSSSDETVRIAEENNVEYIRHCVNTGAAAGTVRAFFNYAHRYDYDIVVQFDGDGQHSAACIKDQIEPIISGNADFVIGSRFIEKGGFKSYALRRMGIRILSWIAKMITGFGFTDLTSGARAFSKNIIDFISIKYHHQVYDSLQMVLLGNYCGARFYEVPVIMKPRIHGKSSFNAGNSLIWMLKSAINGLGVLIKYGKGIR
jgi:glycosyltransferase involved in cell wall biosynthesis